ncbi:MAG TPA: hypothetical protein P5260_12745 [Candidatus Competibacter sp.]|nr:hypothetical protein [Candidatus Competibacter sp.]HRX62060.1 hypothetical protein [Candidatus Competibacter sp.]
MDAQLGMVRMLRSTLPNDTEAEYFFVSPPIPGGERLSPIPSWEQMYLETQTTGVEFDEF